MMISSTLEPVVPSESDSALARRSSRLLAAASAAPASLRMRIARPGREPEELELPASAFSLLVRALEEIGEGHAVALMPLLAELTTQEAASLLNVSRPFLIRQLDEGLIPHRKVGTHRRLALSDVLAYRESMKAGRRAALDALTEDAQRLNMGY